MTLSWVREPRFCELLDEAMLTPLPTMLPAAFTMFSALASDSAEPESSTENSDLFVACDSPKAIALPSAQLSESSFSLRASPALQAHGMPFCTTMRSEEHTSELQSPDHLLSRLL